ncbi:hypothetical protein A2U01_0000902 [Trifolium medium]|uniref:Uncharacterized protein n=1 Tax=Trifolium medium TaxID=97028 RepID=A0A392LYT3_9FABA|nr:hypothetical protein [Trifolium medium]
MGLWSELYLTKCIDLTIVAQVPDITIAQSISKHSDEP